MSPPSREVQESLSNKALHLILLPTEACNFRCVYCYEEFKYKRMESYVVQGVKGWIARRAPSLQKLSIGWFGGEPLLALDIIEDISQFVLSEQMNNPFQYFADITTNAYLMKPRTFQQLLDWRVTRFQISFDGPREWHDRKRVRPGGKPTFDQIWDHLLQTRAVKREFEVLVRLHADQENAEALAEFLELFWAEFGDDPRYSMFLRPLGRFGGPSDHLLKVLAHEDAERVVTRLRAMAEARGLHSYTPGEGMCYAARADSYVVRANGRLNKCTLALEHPANQVGRIREDGALDVSGEAMLPWMRGVFTGRKEELECPMIGLAEPRSNRDRSVDIPIAPVKAGHSGIRMGAMP